MRVLLLVDTLAYGGAERVLVTLARGLHERGVDARLAQLNSRGRNPWAAELQAAGIPVLDLGLRSLRDPRPVLGLAAYLRRERVDVVHTHLRYADLVGRAAGALARRPVVSSIHNLIETNFSRGEAARRRLDFLSARALCATVIAVSDAQRLAYQAASGIDPARVETHLNGVDTRVFRPDRAARPRVRAEFGIPLDAPLFITVAVLRPGKGVPYLLEAARTLLGRVAGPRFLIVGDGVERGDLERRAAELGVSDAVRFAGARSDVPTLLAGSDVYVHPSLFEALPTSVLEGMAVGLPVVATRVGGVPEIVADGEAGLLVTPASSAELADALALTCDAGLRAPMGAAARAWVEAHASLPVWLDGIEQVYRRAAEQGPRLVRGGRTNPPRCGWVGGLRRTIRRPPSVRAAPGTRARPPWRRG